MGWRPGQFPTKNVASLLKDPEWGEAVVTEIYCESCESDGENPDGPLFKVPYEVRLKDWKRDTCPFCESKFIVLHVRRYE